MGIKKEKKVNIVNIIFTVISATLSLVNSMAFTNRWLDVASRGILIITLAVVNVATRLIQFIVIKMQQKNLQKSDNLKKKSVELHTYNQSQPDRVSEISFESNHDEESFDDDDFFEMLMRLRQLREQAEQEAEAVEENEKRHAELAKLEAQLSKIKAQASIIFFVGLSTFSDCTFDMFQGIILLNGIEYDNDVELFLLIGTWIGFGEQIFDFFEDMVSLATDSMKEGGIVTYLVSFTLYISILAEQSFGIYIASYGLSGYAQLLVFTIGIHLSLIIVLFCAPFFIYGMRNVGFHIISVAFSVVNAWIFTFKIIDETKVRAVFVIAMALINIFFRTIEICYIAVRKEDDKIGALFVNLSLFSDCIFDIIQAAILFNGIAYGDTIHLFLVIGTGLGSIQQIFIFLMELIMARRKNKEKVCCRKFQFVTYSVSDMIALASQSIGIFIIAEGFSFNNYPTLSMTSYIIEGILLFALCGSCFIFCYFVWRDDD